MEVGRDANRITTSSDVGPNQSVLFGTTTASKFPDDVFFTGKERREFGWQRSSEVVE